MYLNKAEEANFKNSGTNKQIHEMVLGKNKNKTKKTIKQKDKSLADLVK